MSFYIECCISYLKNKSTSLSRCSSMFLLLQGVVPTLYVTDMQLCFLCRTVSPPSASSMFLKCSASFSALLRPLAFHDSVPGHWERSLLIFCNNFVGQLLPLAIILRCYSLIYKSSLWISLSTQGQWLHYFTSFCSLYWLEQMCSQ